MKGKEAAALLVAAVATSALVSAVVSYVFVVPIVKQEVYRELFELGKMKAGMSQSNSTNCYATSLYVPNLGIQNVTVCGPNGFSYLSKCIIAVSEAPNRTVAEMVWTRCAAAVSSGG